MILFPGSPIPRPSSSVVSHGEIEVPYNLGVCRDLQDLAQTAMRQT